MFGIGIDEIKILLVLFLLIIFYFLPSIIASRRKHTKATAIRVLNILTGWTFIGWVIAVVWAYTEDNRQAT